MASSVAFEGVAKIGDGTYEPRLEPPLRVEGEEEEDEKKGKHFLHCINLVRKQDDPTVRRGAVVKAMCICSRYNFIEVWGYGGGSIMSFFCWRGGEGRGVVFFSSGARDLNFSFFALRWPYSLSL